MKNRDIESEIAILRQNAEALRNRKPLKAGFQFSEAEALERISDLEEHLRELEAQNEELRHLWAATEVLNDKYTGLYDFTPTGYFMLSREGNIIELNLSGADMLGKDRLRLKNTQFGFFVTGDTRPVFNLFLEKVFSTKAKENCEVALSVKDLLPVFVHLSGILTENGEQCLVTAVDITERKNAEMAMQQSDKRLVDIMFNMADWVWEVDENGIYTYSSQKSIDLFGRSREDIIGKSPFDFMLPDEAKRVAAIFSEIVADKKPIKDLENWIVGKHGEQICLLTNGVPVWDKEGHFRGYRGVDKNITERKQAEVLLEQTRNNYESFFNTIDEFLFVLDEGGNIIHTNSTVIDRLGYSREELYGKPVVMIHPAERRGEAGRIVVEMISGSELSCLVPVITKSGIQIPVETKISHGFWNGKPVIFGITKDISKVQVSEEKFSKLFYINPSACGLTDLATHAYTEVNEAFFTLFGFTRNEVIGKTALELGILTREAIDSIMLSADSHGNVTNAEANLVAKNGEVKHVQLSSDNIYIQDKKYRYTVVHDITERKRAEEALRESEDQFRSLIQYSGDPIFSFSPDETYKFVNEAFAVVFGLKPEDLIGKSPHDIFPFEEAEQRLQVVRQVFLTGHKGEIEVRVVNAAGDEYFYLTLLDPVKNDKGKVLFVTCISKDITERKLAEVKLRDAKVKAEESDRLKSAFLAGLATDTESISLEKAEFNDKLKILIAEDDEVSEVFLSITVKNFSRETLYARSGTEAVELCRNNPDIELVLMDINMPGLDGYEATQAIRQFNPGVVIIAQTAFCLHGEKEKAIAAGCNDYLSKPVDSKLLKKTIQKHFGNHQGAAL